MMAVNSFDPEAVQYLHSPRDMYEIQSRVHGPRHLGLLARRPGKDVREVRGSNADLVTDAITDLDRFTGHVFASPYLIVILNLLDSVRY